MMRFIIVPGAEDGSTHTNHRASAGDGLPEVIGHTHGQYIYGYIIVFFAVMSTERLYIS